MSTQRKLRRGNKTTSDSFTGAQAETVYETDNNRLVNHDGSKAGGYPVPNFLDIINGYFQSATASGTNTVTLSLPYAPTAYSTYQKIVFKPANTNTGAVTLNVNSLGAKNIYKDDGSGTLVALVAGDLKANIPATVIYDGTQFVLQTGGGASADVQTFTSSGTWTKPSRGSYAIIIGWGGGGSGASSTSASHGGGGGGGGSYKQAIIPLSSLSSTESVTIGAGGTSVTSGSGNAGGDTTLGTKFTAYGAGGGAGSSTTAKGGGGGGGTQGAGSNGGAQANNNLASPTTAMGILGAWAARRGGSSGFTTIGDGGAPLESIGVLTNNTDYIPSLNATFGGGAGGHSVGTEAERYNGRSSVYGGGGGGWGGDTTTIGGNGGASEYGGGGGGGGAGDSSPGAGTGGTSKYGGNGGNGGFDTTPGTAGSQPGGGGGGSETGTASGAGGAGKLVVIVI